MTCEVDIKAYALGEASAAERQAVEAHLPGCASCKAELNGMGTLRAAFMAMPDEEPPRRIAFVSDKIFEPKWWQRPVFGMSLAQMLAPAALAALAAFAVLKTQAPAQAAASVNVEQRIAAAVDQAIAGRLDAAVKQAVAETEARGDERAAQLVQATERRLRAEHTQKMSEALAYVETNLEMLRKRETKFLRASADANMGLGARQ